MTAPFVPASEKQLAFITDLLSQKVMKPETKQMMEEAVAGTKLGEGDKSVSKSQASKWIEWLLAQERLPKEKPVFVDPPEGMHASEWAGKPKITKVYKTRSGHIVAKALVQNRDGKWSFVYEGKRGLKGLSEATLMSAEEAKAFGKTYGICVNCAADLTDERSIYAGYGPVCAKNRGWWYPTMTEALAGLELSEKGEAMTKLVEMVTPTGLPTWVEEGEGEDTEWATEYEGYLVSVFPHPPPGPVSKWGIYLSWGSMPDKFYDKELDETYDSPGAARVAAIKYIDAIVAEEVKAEKMMEEHFAKVEAEADSWGGPVDDLGETDEAAIFDTPKPPTPLLVGGSSVILSTGPTIVSVGGGGAGGSSAGSTPGYGAGGGAGAKVTYPAKFEVESIEFLDESDEEIDDDEPEFVEIPLESLLLGDDL